ncbi:PAS domain S-box protein [Paenibacillus sp. FJAT-26967]|uniref:PAS domain S-box protein n=1 Tax=Paenibacillus sp. FJAT-26967 TaxID=1729690 RepID=UPI000838B612|nr:PAS domain S-box protein [Paenibacillus sp. FJAT-26967]
MLASFTLKEDNEGLNESDPMFAHAFHHALIGLAVVSREGRFLRVNHSLCELLGYKPEELLSANAEDLLVSSEDLRFLADASGPSAANSRQIEKSYTSRTGEPRWGLLRISSFRTGDGEVRFYVQLQDWTYRKLLEKNMKRSRLEVWSLFQHNPDTICILDLKGRIVSSNLAMIRFTGYDPLDLRGVYILPFILPQDKQAAWKLFEEAMAGRSSTAELSFSRKAGGWATMEVRTLPIVVGQTVEGIYAIAKDLSGRKKAEEMLRTSEKLSAVGQLAAGVAHEIRNPLTALKGFTQFLQSGAVAKETYYEIMMSELNRIDLIITELLMLAKPRTSEFKRLDPQLMIRHVVTLLEPEAALNNVQFVIIAQNSLSDMMGAENQLKQLFINLLKNAVESMPGGGQIEINLHQDTRESIYVEIRDQGCGISPEELMRIGEPFYSTKDQGTGLGMMVSRQITEEHKGTIEIESVTGEGTTVRVRLPLKRTTRTKGAVRL